MKTILIVSSLLLAIVASNRLSGDRTSQNGEQNGGGVVGDNPNSSFSPQLVNCAAEGGSCSIPSGSQNQLYDVSYGTTCGNYYKQIHKRGDAAVPCAVATFNAGQDPYFLVNKHCYRVAIKVSSSVYSAGTTLCNNGSYPADILSCPNGTTASNIFSATRYPNCVARELQAGACLICNSGETFPVTLPANNVCLAARLPYGCPNNADF